MVALGSAGRAGGAGAIGVERGDVVVRLAARGDLAAEAGGVLDRRASRARGGIWCARPGGETTRASMSAPPARSTRGPRDRATRDGARARSYRPIRTPRCPASAGRPRARPGLGPPFAPSRKRRPRAPSPRAPASPRWPAGVRRPRACASRVNASTLAAFARSAHARVRLRRDALYSRLWGGPGPGREDGTAALEEIRLERRTA